MTWKKLWSKCNTIKKTIFCMTKEDTNILLRLELIRCIWSETTGFFKMQLGWESYKAVVPIYLLHGPAVGEASIVSSNMIFHLTPASFLSALSRAGPVCVSAFFQNKGMDSKRLFLCGQTLKPCVWFFFRTARNHFLEYMWRLCGHVSLQGRRFLVQQHCSTQIKWEKR